MIERLRAEVAERDDGDEELAPDAAHDLRRREERVGGDRDDAPHFIDLQPDHARRGVAHPAREAEAHRQSVDKRPEAHPLHDARDE